MERRRDDVALPHGHHVFALLRQHFYAVADRDDLRRADEHHLHRRPLERAAANRALELAAVAVAADADVERAERRPRVVLDLAGEQDCAGARAEDRALRGEAAQRVEAAVAEELEHRRRLAAGDHQRVRAVELARVAHEECLGAELGEAAAMRVEVALRREDADVHHPRACSISCGAMAATASPFIVPVTCSLTSSSTLGSLSYVVARTIARARTSAP